MRNSRIKVIKKYIDSLRLKRKYSSAVKNYIGKVKLGTDQEEALYKTLKRAKSKANLLANIPNNPSPISKKIHAGESLSNFSARRQVCNKKRRGKRKETKICKIENEVSVEKEKE
ncbi:MAG TPA: hypothetical protein ENI08_02840 [Candidatus Dependentiae bacterium]|nr:hypothetical protein [Candidatus Dependentiae bacterium]